MTQKQRIMIAYVFVLTGHVLAQVLNIANMFDSPRAWIWSSMMTFSMLFNCLFFLSAMKETYAVRNYEKVPIK